MHIFISYFWKIPAVFAIVYDAKSVDIFFCMTVSVEFVAVIDKTLLLTFWLIK